MSTPYHFYEGHSSLFQNKWKESTTIYHHFAYLFKVFPLFSQPYTYRRCLPPRVPLQPAVDWKIQNRGTKPTKTFKTPFRSACPLIKYPPLPTKRVTCPLARAEAPPKSLVLPQFNKSCYNFPDNHQHSAEQRWEDWGGVHRWILLGGLENV